MKRLVGTRVALFGHAITSCQDADDPDDDEELFEPEGDDDGPEDIVSMPRHGY